VKDKINKRWVISGFIWAGVIFLTCWNISLMERIKSPAEKTEISRNEGQFLRYNSENISRVLKKKASFYQSVESLKLGILSVENQLNKLAAKYDLKGVRLETQPDEAGQEGVPVKLVFEGSFKRTLELLGVLEKDYPYLVINKMMITPYQLMNKAKFRVLFRYRYRISTSARRT
jgi:hypothetical protein